MAFQDEFDAVVARYNQLRSDETVKLQRVIAKLKDDEQVELDAIRAKFNKPPASRSNWIIRCQEYGIEFELPGFSDKPFAVPGIDYYITHLNVAGHAFQGILKELRKRRKNIPEFFSWTQTSPRGKTETWSEESLYRSMAIEHAAG